MLHCGWQYDLFISPLEHSALQPSVHKFDAASTGSSSQAGLPRMRILRRKMSSTLKGICQCQEIGCNINISVLNNGWWDACQSIALQFDVFPCFWISHIRNTFELIEAQIDYDSDFPMSTETWETLSMDS